VDQIDVEECGAHHINNEELRSGDCGVLQNGDPSGFSDCVEVEALLGGYSLGVWRRWNAAAMEAQKCRGGTSLGDDSLGHGGPPSRWRHN
jgi:hypothetical protein